MYRLSILRKHLSCSLIKSASIQLRKHYSYINVFALNNNMEKNREKSDPWMNISFSYKKVVKKNLNMRSTFYSNATQ